VWLCPHPVRTSVTTKGWFRLSTVRADCRSFCPALHLRVSLGLIPLVVGCLRCFRSNPITVLTQFWCSLITVAFYTRLAFGHVHTGFSMGLWSKCKEIFHSSQQMSTIYFLPCTLVRHGLHLGCTGHSRRLLPLKNDFNQDLRPLDVRSSAAILHERLLRCKISSSIANCLGFCLILFLSFCFSLLPSCF
jgi:hypothetical protein